ncbi:MAG TPA: ribbon-helix-helix protein, CopG family [Methanobacteriales archaeon]|nr:ribbon-helix-helix protein, CopG family [Methanobacteriales archaeon]MDI3483990.1 hypothetical protein [Methanobacteriaceae archaeon]HIH61645.1 ribbon-helix-helix protein, CopG family [Methanobacteriales archaeon]
MMRMERTITLRIDENLYRALKKQAIKDERTISQEIRHAIREFLKNKNRRIT